MRDIILFNLWNVFYLFLVCVIVAGTLIVTMLAGIRMAFFFKSFRDPINALKKEPSLKDVVDVASEQDAIAGNRL